MNKRGLFGSLAICATLIGSPVLGAICEGRIVGVSVEVTSGELLVDQIQLTGGAGTMNWPRFCSLNTTANGVSPEGCKALYAAMLTAQAQAKPMTFYMQGMDDCFDYTTWQYLPGFYFFRIGE